jgi:hypothetical protein
MRDKEQKRMSLEQIAEKSSESVSRGVDSSRRYSGR